MKIIIAGSRGFNDYKLLKQKLAYFLKTHNLKPEEIEIVSGGAKGADRLGEQFAIEYNIKIKQFIPDWDRYGKSAGIRRNAEMGKYGNACIVFWDGKSRGSKHMIEVSIKEGLELEIIMYKDVDAMDEIIIYTDGGCRGNQKDKNVGGWGVVFKYKEHIKTLYGGEQNTTNNRMELTAAIMALRTLKTTNIPVKVHCDSSYVVNGMNNWVKGWIKKGWRKSDMQPVENKELWQELWKLSQTQSDIQWIKVKGHSGVELNELADKLANKGMDKILKRY